MAVDEKCWRLSALYEHVMVFIFMDMPACDPFCQFAMSTISGMPFQLGHTHLLLCKVTALKETLI